MRQENNERTLFFDFIPLTMGNKQEFKTRFHLYTVPGQPLYDDTRRLVIKGVDGIMFVVDSELDKMEANLASWENLKNNLAEEGYALQDMPIVFQFNKRDSKTAATYRRSAQMLNPNGFPEFQTIATNNDGVFDAFKCLAKKVIKDFSKQP